ncbi:WD40 repeat [Emericellopsis cladophorae]|uniref:WD40 repeat n=1 Tax=Emericellopsis cladophorae TaxID=2686198 RepID=A0A9P9Y2Y0_9HYPO|nr:WD40 repeat [Emericellopsis cladophorae]KAI6782386.1 WD40 repeat [Emericellopsis cladophorae]
MDLDSYDINQPNTSSPPLPSSSPASNLLSPTRSSRRKERRAPSVTPRRFGRFFTPRNSGPITGRRILASVDSEELNRQPNSPHSVFSDALHSDAIDSSPIQSPSARKRGSPGHGEPIASRRGIALNDMAPPRLNFPPRQKESSQDVLGEWRSKTLNRFFKTSRGLETPPKDKLVRDALGGPPNKRHRAESPERHVPVPTRKLANRGLEAQIAHRAHGDACFPGKQYLAYPAADPRFETANFYSNKEDHETILSYEGPGETTPFCQASFNSSSVTAIGDEQGYVRLLRTDGWCSSAGKVESFFKAQDNAIIDMDISADDMRLVTACGDWSGRVFDMTTQSAAVNLKGHASGMRQALFQPGRSNGDVLATAAKDGCINIWDLRCSSLPVNTFSTMAGDDSQQARRRNLNLDILDAKPTNPMTLAHVRVANGGQNPASITALQWFPSGREHLLVSGSESSAAIKLWDMRCIKPRNREQAAPLAITAEPRHHTFRSYGLTSLALNGDATRLYSVCKDNTIYAYSTAHLILGHAPELVDSSIKRKPRGVQGIGPLYGWKNERLSGITFWVKSALRRANGSQAEILAVGGNDKAPVLFPTDEGFMKSALAQQNHIMETCSAASMAPLLSASRSTPSSLTPSTANIPIFKCGTALVNGHEKEVSTVSWTHDGKLVSLSDDSSVRHWQGDDGGDRARYLRGVGDFGGERWNCGWADVGADWDEDEC